MKPCKPMKLLGAPVHTFTTDLEIGGWEYEIEVEYSVHLTEFPPDSGKTEAEIELQKVWVYNEQKDKIAWPWLLKIDDLLIERIKESGDE